MEDQYIEILIKKIWKLKIKELNLKIILLKINNYLISSPLEILDVSYNGLDSHNDPIFVRFLYTYLHLNVVM